MKNCYLIVRYKENNEVQVVKLNSRWYLDGCKNDMVLKANRLEAIDLVTTRFKSREEMVLRLKNNGYILSTNVDVFIASKNKKNVGNGLKIYEVIYNANNKNEMMEFRDIAKASLNNNIEAEKLKIKSIFDRFASKIFYDRDFSSYLKSDFTNIYNKVIEFYSSLKSSKSLYEAKYNNYWMLKSYTLIRNIIDAFNRFTCNDKDYLRINKFERKKVEEEILIKIDENYIDGQLSLFDEEVTNHLSKPKNDEVDDSNNICNNVNYEKTLSVDEKKSFVLNMINDFPVTLFKCIDNSIIINSSYFVVYFDSIYESKFKNLSDRFISLLYYYTLHYEKYRDALYYNQNTTVLEEELRKDRNRINRFLSGQKNVEMVYDWSNIYLKCLEFENDMLGSDGMKEYEKIYVKK